MERKASMVGGAALAASGLAQLTHKKILPGLAMMAAGSMFLYRGKTGHCNVYEKMGVDTAGADVNGLTVEKVMTINRQPREVYDFWHNFENLPKFMKHLDTVQTIGTTKSHWKAHGPGNISVEWDAELTEDQPGRRISWHSLENSDIPNQGNVEFNEAPAGRGTELKVKIQYFPPGGTAGKVAAKILHGLNEKQVEEDMRRLKQILETGETATSERMAYRTAAA
jgi:uncharacterized membrane protein